MFICKVSINSVLTNNQGRQGPYNKKFNCHRHKRNVPVHTSTFCVNYMFGNSDFEDQENIITLHGQLELQNILFCVLMHFRLYTVLKWFLFFRPFSYFKQMTLLEQESLFVFVCVCFASFIIAYRGCRMWALSSSCKTDQGDFTDWVFFLPSNLVEEINSDIEALSKSLKPFISMEKLKRQ